ncbi:hypothetical protein HB779_17405 [Phyllobacterium sp. 628]|uniref:hypothetical protein n=1 Tax=Phyllobacterium sp. 628 TaxID=2718938 RepID=UPI0016627F0F|nr:hypothetical protein [Phyllobacterium sp. 628]QND53466.1 hypothetical protein HB779_17405 [Phyllobacterium sp. 628]
MIKMLEKYRPVFSSENEGGAGTPATPESVLFPDEKPADPPAGEKKPGEGEADGDKKPTEGDNKSGDWKEYVPDPNKSEAENTAAKSEHDKTKPADDKDKKADPLDAVPADGKYALTMPEGIAVDQALLDALGPKFAAKQMTTREAQELTDEYVKVEQARAKTRTENWGKTLEKWVDDAKADKDIGGTKWDDTVATSRRAVNTLGTPELKEYLQASGGGNHPELIRFMAKVGAMIKEDSPADGGAGGSGKPAEPAHVLFPNDAPKG